MTTPPIFTAIGAMVFTTLTSCSENKSDDSLNSPSSAVETTDAATVPGQKIIKLREYLLSDFTHQEKKFLSLYGIPADNPTEFRSFTIRLRAAHEKDVEAGQISMMWDNLLAAIASLPEELRINQWIDACIVHGVPMSEQLAAGKYSINDIKAVYRQEEAPHKPLPDDLIAFLDRRIDELANIKGMPFNAALSHLKISFMTDPYMVQVFLDAMENDIDQSRKKRLQELIDSNMKNSPDEPAAGILQVVRNLLIEASKGEARLMTADDYSFEGNPLRTGTDFIYTAPLRELVRVDGDSLFLHKIRRILIIGPGVSMVAVDDLNNPMQMVEPFALLDILLESDKLNLDGLQVDLLDISPDVIGHINFLKTLAEQKKPASLALGLKHIHKGNRMFAEHFNGLGKSIPGAEITENRAITPFYQARKKIQIPSAILSKLRAIRGDMTTTNFSTLGSYDLILCFNTVVYLNEQERALAGIGIRKALSQQGRFIANNGLSKKTDPSEDLLGDTYLPLIKKKWYPYYPSQSGQERSSNKKGSHLLVYKKGL